MANRSRIKPGNIADTQTPKIPPKLFSSARTQPAEKSDDIIVTLSDAYENRRARQVGEWEMLYGQNVYKARFE
jgi:hypothetical protein